MILAGNNTLTLSPAALAQIMQKHLNERRYDGDKVPVRVLAVRSRVDSGATVYDFDLTTDPAPENSNA